MRPAMLIEPPEKPLRVLVSGGAGGLGLEIARRFHRNEDRVHICDVDAPNLLEAMAEHPGMHGTVADVAISDEVRQAVREAVDWMGGVDVLINCAGDAGVRSRIEDVDDEDWDRALAVNLSGTFFCIREVSPWMRAQGSGAIVNIAATSAKLGLPRRAAYAAAKAGVLGLTRTTARELGPDGVRCNAVLPGIVDNRAGRELLDARARQHGISSDEAEADLLAHVSMRSWISQEEVADLAFYLASPAARHITGQEIGVCGNLEWE